MFSLQSISYWKAYFGKPVGSRLGLINGIYPIGALISLPITSMLCDKFGRKRTMTFGLLFIVIGAVLQSASQSYAMLIVSRLVLGFASPISQSVAPILIAELAYPTHRGKVTTMTNSVFFMGSTVAAWVVYGCGFIESEWSWRLPSLLQGLLPLIQISLMWIVPESPRYDGAQVTKLLSLTPIDGLSLKDEIMKLPQFFLDFTAHLATSILNL
jgi:MFS family permease